MNAAGPVGAVAVCMKWVDRRPDVDPLTGEVVHDPRTAGASDADEAALEWALRLGQTWERPVTALCAGPVDADSMLRDALAAGAAHVVRIDCAPETPSAVVAGVLTEALPADCPLVACGNWSLDRGSGSVPAFIAAYRGAAQALGLISIALSSSGSPQPLGAERRLDGGRREQLRIGLPAVISVEGGSARLRRAPMARVLEARAATIPTVVGPGTGPSTGSRHGTGPGPATSGLRAPYRPRARVRPAPTSGSARERILELTGAAGGSEPPQRLVLEPPAAAARVLEQLKTWGYLP